MLIASFSVIRGGNDLTVAAHYFLREGYRWNQELGIRSSSNNTLNDLTVAARYFHRESYRWNQELGIRSSSNNTFNDLIVVAIRY